MPAETAATEPAQEDHMTATLPTCPREDCTFTGPHHTRCYAPRTPQPQPYRFPDGWERGHEAKYWVQTGLTPYGLTLDPERAPGVLNWLGVNYYTPDSPYRPQPAAVVLPALGLPRGA